MLQHRVDLAKNCSRQTKLDQYKYQSHWLIHRVGISFYSDDLEFIASLHEYFPVKWETTKPQRRSVIWVDQKIIAKDNSYHWGELTSADCHFINLNSGQWVLQRDFLSTKKDNTYYVIGDNTIDDSFHNFIRYLLPKLLLKNEALVFHSSCVLDPNTNKAYVFFGHSGAGKTTIARLCQKSKMHPDGGIVLGDDMNLIFEENNQLKVSPSAFGQHIQSLSLVDQSFEIAGLYWLNKSNKPSVSTVKQKYSKLLSSVSGLFWNQLTKKESDLVFTLLKKFELNQVKQLNFNKAPEVWNYVKKHG